MREVDKPFLADEIWKISEQARAGPPVHRARTGAPLPK